MFYVHIENVHSNGPSGNTPRVILHGFGSTVLQRGACVKGSPGMNGDNHADVKQKVGAAACEELI